MGLTGINDARRGVLALLAHRQPGLTICPSEVARAMTAGSTAADWRDAMPLVHAAIDELVADGSVRLSWKGQDLPTRSGPYRIRAV